MKTRQLQTYDRPVCILQGIHEHPIHGIIVMIVGRWVPVHVVVQQLVKVGWEVGDQLEGEGWRVEVHVRDDQVPQQWEQWVRSEGVGLVGNDVVHEALLGRHGLGGWLHGWQLWANPRAVHVCSWAGSSVHRHTGCPWAVPSCPDFGSWDRAVACSYAGS